MLVNRAALDGTPSQTAAMALSSPGAPSTMRNSGRRKPRLMESPRMVRQASALLAAHALDREQHLLAVLAYAKDDKERDGSRFAVEPHAHHCAVENEPHDRFFGKASGTRSELRLHRRQHRAHPILADGVARQASARRTRRCSVLAQVGARDQRVGKRAPLETRSARRSHCRLRPSCSSLARGTSISTGRSFPTATASGGRGGDQRHPPPSLLRRSAYSQWLA